VLLITSVSSLRGWKTRKFAGRKPAVEAKTKAGLAAEDALLKRCRQRGSSE
jgi:hypothetical protein